MNNGKEREGEEAKPAPEECPWCNTTGDTNRTRKIYWLTVLLIAIVIAVIYLLSRI